MIEQGHKVSTAGADLLEFAGTTKFSTILADPPWQFDNRTGKMAPEHKRLRRYGTMTMEDIKELPVAQIAADRAHLYLWVPNALVAEGLEVMRRWGFQYKTNLIWYKIRKDGGPDRRGVGFYFRNVTEMLLFGVRGKNVRTLQPGRTMPNILSTQKREHSRKPDELYKIIEECSWAEYLELFARHRHPGWYQWGDECQNGDAALLSNGASHTLKSAVQPSSMTLFERHRRYMENTPPGPELISTLNGGSEEQ